jgi:uncharacterized protein YciI
MIARGRRGPVARSGGASAERHGAAGRARPPGRAPPVRARIQREHLAHHARLRASGHVVTNGPVIDQPDSSLRGLTFYRTGSLAEARRLAEADPAVRAGLLTVEIMTWYCPPGTMSKPGRTVTV